MMRRIRIFITVLAVLLFLCVVAGFAVGNYFVTLALDTFSDKSVIFGAKHNALDLGPDFHLKQEENAEWLASVVREEWRTESPDGPTLNAYAIPSADTAGVWAVLCHGYNGNGMQLLEAAREFHSRGYNVLLPDARGYGKSGGRYSGMGWLERRDVLAWIDRINARHNPRAIFLYGVSMGGATVLMTAGEALPENVRAAISDCAYASATEEFAYQLRRLYGLPPKPIMYFVFLVARIRAGYWLEDADAASQVAKARIPILLIHGSKDEFVPTAMAHELYAAAGGEKELLIVDSAGHAGSASTDPELYWRTIDQFLAKALRR